MSIERDFWISTHVRAHVDLSETPIFRSKTQRWCLASRSVFILSRSEKQPLSIKMGILKLLLRIQNVSETKKNIPLLLNYFIKKESLKLGVPIKKSIEISGKPLLGRKYSRTREWRNSAFIKSKALPNRCCKPKKIICRFLTAFVCQWLEKRLTQSRA